MKKKKDRGEGNSSKECISNFICTYYVRTYNIEARGLTLFVHTTYIDIK